MISLCTGCMQGRRHACLRIASTCSCLWVCACIVVCICCVDCSFGTNFFQRRGLLSTSRHGLRWWRHRWRRRYLRDRRAPCAVRVEAEAASSTGACEQRRRRGDMSCLPQPRNDAEGVAPRTFASGVLERCEGVPAQVEIEAGKGFRVDLVPEEA